MLKSGFLTFIHLFTALVLIEPAWSQVADRNASEETKHLYENLIKLNQQGIMIGHQDDLAYGVNWKYEQGRSDVKDLTGELPAVFGWDVAGIEKDSDVNIDSVPFNKMKEYIRYTYDKGLINTLSWHLDNPATGKTAWDAATATVTSILPGGASNAKFNTWLDKLSVFLLSLKGSDGKNIPILFRPYHELTGSWFWWGKKHCSPDEFKTLWKYTFNYLRQKGVHNLIYVYNTADFGSKAEFLERYPGDDFTDIVSFDAYHYPKSKVKFAKDLNKRLAILEKIAKEHKKIPALAETGLEAVPDSLWWTKSLWPAIKKHNVSYVLLWRNAGKQASGNMHYYVPYPGQASAADFLRFFNMDKTLFEKDLQKINVYK